MQLHIHRHTVLWCICQALKFKWEALIGTARGFDYLDQPPCFAPVVPGRARGAAAGRAENICCQDVQVECEAQSCDAASVLD